MLPVQQRILGSGLGDDVRGDCVKCCVASILELPYEDVPHFVADEWLIDGSRIWWLAALNDWLQYRGFNLEATQDVYWKNEISRECKLNDRYERLSRPRFRDFRTGFWMASVISENFADSTHAIVMHGDSVAFDPSTKPRRTPYEFVAETLFVCKEPWRAK